MRIGSSPDSAVSMTRGIKIYIAKKRKYVKNDRSGEEDFAPDRTSSSGLPVSIVSWIRMRIPILQSKSTRNKMAYTRVYGGI
jgi:hypothetical protein